MIKSRSLRLTGHIARIEEGRSSLEILTGKHTGKRHSGKSRRRWEDNTAIGGIWFIRLRMGITEEPL